MSGVKAAGNGAMIGHGTAAPNANADYTHAMFVKPDTAGGFWAFQHELVKSASGGDPHDGAFLDGSDHSYNIEVSNNVGTQVADFIGTFVDGTWYFVAIVRRGNALEYWAAPADGETDPVLIKSVTQSLSGRNAATRLWVGGSEHAVLYDTMLYQTVVGRKLWQAALSAEELRVESLQKQPVKTADLWGAWLSKHKDDLTDYSGNGRPWNWAIDVAQNPPPGTDTTTDPDDSIDTTVPDGTLGENPEESAPAEPAPVPTQLSEADMRNIRYLAKALDAFSVIPSYTGGKQFWHSGGAIVNASGAMVVIDAGVVVLDEAGPNFVERTAAGVVSANTSAFTAGSVPLYHVTMVNSEIDAIRDMRGS